MRARYRIRRAGAWQAAAVSVMAAVPWGIAVLWSLDRSSDEQRGTTVEDAEVPKASEPQALPEPAVSRPQFRPERRLPDNDPIVADEVGTQGAGAEDNAVPRGPELPAFSELQERWADEPENPEWTSNATTFISAILEAPSLDGSIPSFRVRCGSTVCQAEFDGDAPHALVRVAEFADSSGPRFRYQRIASDAGYMIRAYFTSGPSEK